MNYTMTTPCSECPFLATMARSEQRPGGFMLQRLTEFASGEFACHRACDVDENDMKFVPKSDATPHCAGALIFLEKRNMSHQMMRICERLGMYDRTKLNMQAPVR